MREVLTTLIESIKVCLMNTVTAPAEVRWNDIVDYARAIALTGWSVADIARTPLATLECRAVGAWDANQRESYVGYRSIIRHRQTAS